MQGTMGHKKKKKTNKQAQRKPVPQSRASVAGAVTAVAADTAAAAADTVAVADTAAAASDTVVNAADTAAAAAANTDAADTAAAAADATEHAASDVTAAADRAEETTPAASSAFAEFDNNSLEDPELKVIPFDRGGVESKRVQDPRLKPHGMPRHKPKAWRDLPIGGKIYKVVYWICLCVFCVSIGILLARGVAYIRHKSFTGNVISLYDRDGDRRTGSLGTTTPVPLTTMTPTEPPEATSTPDPGLVTTTDLTSDATPAPTDPTPTPVPISTPVPVARPSFAKLLGINRDVVGWIELPVGTVINYPVLQSHDPNMPDFYLNHDLYRQTTYYGSIFMSYGCDSVNLGFNTILSGHNMQDGEMFRQISNYTSAYMWREHPRIYFDTLYENYEWEIFAAYTVNAETEMIPVTFSSIQEFVDYCTLCQQRSVVKLGQNVKFSGLDRVLTLITCSYNGHYVNERTFAVFRLVSRSGEMDSTGSWRPTTPAISGSW